MACACRHKQQRLCLVLLLTLGTWAIGGTAEDDDRAAECMNSGSITQQTTYKDFVNGSPTRLRVHKAVWSQRKPEVVLTVTTGLTITRLDQLEAQCESWKGPLSAAVYIVLHDNTKDGLSQASKDALADASAKLEAFHARMEANPHGCALSAMLLYETVADELMTVLLPINTMRNYALVAARTRLVAMIDVDLLISSMLFDWLKDPKNSESIVKDCAEKKVYVLPAFETAHNPNLGAAHAVARRAVKLQKKQLKQMVDERLVHQFALYLFKAGHTPTNYPAWFAMGQAYPIVWKKGFEPWFIIDRFLNPFYDCVFRGYGWNKVTQVANVHAQNFTFMAHPSGFIVHRQHSRSSADKMYQTQKKAYEANVRKDPSEVDRSTTLAGLTHKFRNRVLATLEAHTYVPSVDDGVRSCVKSLPWWQSGSSPVVLGKGTIESAPSGEIDEDSQQTRLLRALVP